MAESAPLRLIILGATGSVGRQTLQVVEHLNALARTDPTVRPVRVVGCAADSRADALFDIAQRHAVTRLALTRASTDVPAAVTLFTGPDAAERLVRETDADIVMSAIVGIAGLRATLAAVQLGRAVALANKETLVAAGALVLRAARASASTLLPVDSEHSALWQCLPPLTPPAPFPSTVARAILTASGGPFRDWTREQIARATPDDALRHPTWDMGPKVTIDCASLMNKALELIEAHWLFSIPAERLSAVIHPRSIVHALAEYHDGSVIAHLGAPDMRTPIQHALTHPNRLPGTSRRLSIEDLGELRFHAPDLDRFPALALGHRVMREGGTSGAVMNAANEAAVRAFIEKRIGFLDIASLTEAAMGALRPSEIRDLADVEEADEAGRAFVEARVGRV